jgi:signal transduction histidine kinase
MHNVMTRYATDHYQSGLSQMEVLYETRQKEAQIAALDKERGLYLWLLAAAIGLIALLAVLFVYRHLAHRRQKALLAAKVALETETKERQILARDLHDGLGGMLSVLRMKLEDGSHDSLALLDAIHTELRRTAHHLMPEELLKNGLESALRDFAISVPNAKFQAIGDITLNKDKELVLYRCAYELVNNAMKHAEASNINIQLMQEPHQVTFSVSDDGKGMVRDGKSLTTMGTEGMGLQNIRERIEPYKGRLDIVSDDGQGTDINIILPL